MAAPADDPSVKHTDYVEALAEMRANGKPGEKWRRFDKAVVDEFRATGGRSVGELPIGVIALITMKGAKTGLERTVPLGIFELDGRIVLVGTQGGLPTHPQWYYNLVANPDVTVEWRGETFRARALLTEGEDRQRIFSQLPEVPFKEYMPHTGSRVIPIFELQRV